MVTSDQATHEPHGSSLERLQADLEALLHQVVDAAGADFGRLSIRSCKPGHIVIDVGFDDPQLQALSRSASNFCETPSPATWGRVLVQPGDAAAFAPHPAVRDMIETAQTKSLLVQPIFDGSQLIGTAAIGTISGELPSELGDRLLLQIALDALALAARTLSYHLARPAGREPESLPAPQTRLSPRQLEVLHLLADGFRVQQIASRLLISENTARNHIKAVLHAYGVSRQVELIELIHHDRQIGDGPRAS